MWMDQSRVVDLHETGAEFSEMPPFRLAGLASLLPLPLPAPFPLPFPLGRESQTAMAMEYASSPVEHPALHMRSVAALSFDLRAYSCGMIWRVSAFIAPG